MLIDLTLLVIGGALLYFGAEWLVGGSAGLARAYGIPSIVIGLTIVAYGTSAPEVVVSTMAALDGKGAIALGNVVGSNIANLGLILGLTAVISPPRVEGSLIKREVPVMVLAAVAVPLIIYDGMISRLEAGALIVAAVAFTVWTVRASRGASSSDPALAEAGAEAAASAPVPIRTKPRLLIVAALGLALLIAGGKIFVDGAVGLATLFGIDERIIGLTIVAVGTSLPELATSLIAALRGQSSIAVGNVVGSNVFNVLLIIGVAAMIRPIEIDPATMRADVVAMFAITVFGAFLLRGARSIGRFEGAMLLTGYGLFIAALAATL